MKCHCGNEFESVYRKNIKGCGCLKESRVDHSGEIIDGVEVLLKLKKKNKNEQILYRMKCHCGKEFESVYRKNIKSCGCQSGHRKNHSGEVINGVTILSKSSKKNKGGDFI